MLNGIPAVYTLLRAAWSGLHVVLLAALFTTGIIWAIHDGQGLRLLNHWWQTTRGVQASIYNFIPFPWDAL